MTPEWVSRKRKSLRARERPLRATSPGRERRKAATRQEALIRRLEKTAAGERRGEAFSALDGDVQCRACRWWARLRIGSLGTTFFVGKLKHAPPSLICDTVGLSLGLQDLDTCFAPLIRKTYIGPKTIAAPSARNLAGPSGILVPVQD
jgi:hypothetical protein